MMYLRLVSHHGSFKLHRSPAPSAEGKISGRNASDLDIQRGVDGSNGEELRAFYLAMQVLIEGQRRQGHTVELLTTTGVRDVKTGVRRVADYLELYRHASVVLVRKNKTKRNKDEMTQYNELNELLRTVFEPIKVKLGLPAVNPSEYSYTVPATLIPAVRSSTLKGHLESLVTHGALTTCKFEKTKGRLQRDYPDIPDVIEKIIAGMELTKSRDHLSAISFNDSKGQLLVSIVNVTGDLLQMEGYKFLRLIEEHGNDKGGWLSLGKLDRKEEWLPDPLIKFNKESSGEIIAHYSATESSLEVQCRVTDKRSSKTEPSAQALFIIDQDYLVCLYVAIMRLKEDKQNFERLREIAETKEVADMRKIEADLFD